MRSDLHPDTVWRSSLTGVASAWSLSLRKGLSRRTASLLSQPVATRWTTPRFASFAVPTSAERPEEVLLDTSVAVALAVADHEGHATTLEVVRGLRPGLAGHAWFETFSVLTRLPPPVRRAPADVVRLLLHDFPASRFLDERSAERLGKELPQLDIAGGAVYDALVGAAARQHEARLLTRDRRALGVYRALKVDATLIA